MVGRRQIRPLPATRANARCAHYSLACGRHPLTYQKRILVIAREEMAMAKRSFNPRLVKIHRSYQVVEIANLYGTHKNLVRAWIKQGLSTIDESKPYLIRGDQLRFFLEARRSKNKCKCKIDEIYCVKCRSAKKPLGNMVDYNQSVNGGISNIMGICPDCGSRIFRCTSERTFKLIQHCFEVTIPIAQQRIDAVNLPIVNSDFKQGE